jgi:hypothetical protein
LFDLLEPWDVRALSIRKTADLPLQLWVGIFPRFVAIGFYFLSETLPRLQQVEQKAVGRQRNLGLVNMVHFGVRTTIISFSVDPE